MKPNKDDLIKLRVEPEEKYQFRLRVGRISRAVRDFVQAVNSGDIKIINKYFQNN